MRKVANADGVLLLDIGEVRALVVDLEVEDSMLVGKSKGNAVDGSILSGASESEVEAVEGGEHGELELEDIVFRKGKGNPLVPAVLGQRDGVRHIVLDSVDFGVELLSLLQLVLDAVDSQDANLLERPASHSSGEFLVVSLDALAAHLGDLGVEPLVLQHLSRAKNSHASRVARLHHRHKRQLLARSEQVISVKHLGLLLGVISVSSGRRANNRGEQSSRAKDMANSVGEGQDTTGDLKVGLKVRANVGWRIEDEDVVGFGSGNGVVVEVIDDGAGALNGQGNVELGKKRDERGGRWDGGGQRKQDVALGVDEVDETVWGQVGTEALDLGRQE